jgi:hypothetical protein
MICFAETKDMNTRNFKFMSFLLSKQFLDTFIFLYF